MQIKFSDGSAMVVGNATKDAEFKHVGEKQSAFCTFGLVVGKNGEDAIYANCKVWKKLAEYAANIRKGDPVCVIGRIEESEYNGKMYKNVVAEWLNIAKLGTTDYEQQELPGFVEVNDSDLPF